MLEGWQVATAQLAEVSGGFLGVQVDGLGEGATLGTFGCHHQFGFRSRPRDPGSNGAGCSVLYAYEGGVGHVWLLADPRYVAAIPDEGSGGSVQYAVTGEGKVGYLLAHGEDGKVVVKVPNTADSIRLEHGTTGAIVEVNATTVELGATGGGPVALAAGIDAQFAAIAVSITSIIAKLAGSPDPPVPYAFSGTVGALKVNAV